jgi:hypothetical protein
MKAIIASVGAVSVVGGWLWFYAQDHQQNKDARVVIAQHETKIETIQDYILEQQISNRYQGAINESLLKVLQNMDGSDTR